MRIAVIGAGAIGSVVAAYLAKSGNEVLLIGRADQVAAIKKSGLRIKGVRGDEVVHFPVAEKLDAEYPLVIFATKTQNVEEAYQTSREFLDGCLVLTTQNGVQADNLLSGHVEKERIISSIVMFGATYVHPGEVTFNFEGDWIIGKPYMLNDMIVEDIAGVLRKAFSVIVSNDIMGMKWLKLFVNFNNCIPALTGQSMQETFSDIDLCRLSIRLLKEGVDIVTRASIPLVSLPNFPKERILGLVDMLEAQAAGIIQKTMTTLSKEPLYGSILQSILRKKKSEIEFINGEIDLLAKQIGSRAPLNRKVVDMVNQVERTGRFFSPDEIKKEYQLT